MMSSADAEPAANHREPPSAGPVTRNIAPARIATSTPSALGPQSGAGGGTSGAPSSSKPASASAARAWSAAPTRSSKRPSRSSTRWAIPAAASTSAQSLACVGDDRRPQRPLVFGPQALGRVPHARKPTR